MKKMKFMVILAALLTTFLTAQAQVKITGGPVLQNVTQNSFTVIWTTDMPAVSWVEIAPDDGTHFYNVTRPAFYDKRGFGRRPIDSLHVVTVTGLEPGTAYRYRIMCKGVLSAENRARIIYTEGKGTDLNTQPTMARTIADDYDKVRFAVVNDMHEHDSLFCELFKDAKDKYDFVCFNGDMTSTVDNASDIMDNYMRSASKLFATDTPVCMCRGNHEYRGNHALDFPRYMQTPTGKTYYTKKYGKFFFIFLDSGEDKPDTDIRNLDIMRTEEYVKEEAEWLKEVVNSDDYKNAAVRIAFCHMPPKAEGWHGNAMVHKYFVPLLNGGLDLMLCAHIHRYRYDKPGTLGADFPILCNNKEERLDAEVTAKGIKINIFDPSGKETHSISFSK
ncbi:MAG: metallophosphoesterase [Candidatus Cryptobacteroides sp.]